MLSLSSPYRRKSISEPILIIILLCSRIPNATTAGLLESRLERSLYRSISSDEESPTVFSNLQDDKICSLTNKRHFAKATRDSMIDRTHQILCAFQGGPICLRLRGAGRSWIRKTIKKERKKEVQRKKRNIDNTNLAASVTKKMKLHCMMFTMSFFHHIIHIMKFDDLL